MPHSVYLPIALISLVLAALFFSLLINGLFVKFSKTLGIRNHAEHQIRWASTSKPAFGGISFYIIFLLSVAAGAFIFEHNESFKNVPLLGLIGSASLAFLMGLFDDAYNTRVWLKLLSQITCGMILIVTGTWINLFDQLWVNYLVTIFWVVAMMNSINMLDNMDGITTIISTFIFLTFSWFLLAAGHYTSPYLLILLGLISALLGFLFYNWNPSKIYMGDTGSQFLGLVLAFFGIYFLWNAKQSGIFLPADQRLLLILTMFALPITDTTTVVIKRIRKGKSPFVGGKDHTTHHLSYLGLSDRGVARTFILISMLSGTLVIWIYAQPFWSVWFDLQFGLYFLIIFSVLFFIANRNTPKS